MLSYVNFTNLVNALMSGPSKAPSHKSLHHVLAHEMSPSVVADNFSKVSIAAHKVQAVYPLWQVLKEATTF